MTWFDKLKGILNIDIKTPILSLNFNSNNKVTNKYYVSLERELDINLAALSPKQKQDIKKIFPQILANEKTIFKKD